jgi:hypothetical protein
MLNPSTNDTSANKVRMLQKLTNLLGPKVRNFFVRFGKTTNLDEPHKKLPRVLSILSISQIPPKYSTTKEIRAWISLCTVACEIANGLPFPMMVVDNAKAVMAVVVLQRHSYFINGWREE